MLIMTFIECALAFCIGSIPFGIYICEYFKLAPPNTYGSKNIGASNVARQNLAAGALTLLLDALKGAIAVLIFKSSSLVVLSVVAGHCYSPLMNYKGGKGVATALGGFFVINYGYTLILVAIWAMSFCQNRTPRKASLLCAYTTVLYTFILPDFILMLTCILIIIRHRKHAQPIPQTSA